MRPSALARYLVFAIENRFPVLITGEPGIGKSDLAEQAAAGTAARLIISHPVVSDPTDYKGLPFPKPDGTADFLPFGDLYQIITATEKTIFFLDDLGQASPGVQAAAMQLLLARRINGHKVSDHVTFLAATNRRQDKAGVTGMLEPVKSRFLSIIPLEVNTDDWVKWALNHNIPTELIAFIRFRPDLLNAFIPSKELVNSSSPRTVANLGVQQAAGLPREFELDVFTGAAGKGFALEYLAFLKIFRELPTMDSIIMQPKKAKAPTDPGALYATACALAKKMNDQNIANICIYLDRLPIEMQIACMTEAVAKDDNICLNKAYIDWSVSKGGLML